MPWCPAAWSEQPGSGQRQQGQQQQRANQAPEGTTGAGGSRGWRWGRCAAALSVCSFHNLNTVDCGRAWGHVGWQVGLEV